MDDGKKLLLISYSSVPMADRHSAVVTGAVRALARLFETIDVVAIKGDFVSHIERFHGGRLLRVPLSGDSAIERVESFRRAVRRQIDSDSYDVVHVRSPIEGTPICDARAEMDSKVVYEAGVFAAFDASESKAHDDEIASVEAQFGDAELRCADRADLVIVHSEAALRALRQRGIKTRAEVIHGGVNIDAFDWETTEVPQIPTILCLGRLLPSRDPLVVIEAVRRVLEVMPVRLRWIGDPSTERREAYAAIAVELGVDRAVSFEGSVTADDLPRLVGASTICLAPAGPDARFTEWGDLPEGLLEFMACRRTVVAARTAGVEELVRDGTEAMLYAPGDPAGLTSGILFLLRNARHRQLLAKRAYRRVREQFSESSMRRRIAQAYRDLLGIQGPGPGAGDDASLDEPAGASGGGSAAVEPITAVMEAAAEGSRRVRVEGSTRRVQGASEIDEHYDTQPNIHMKESEPPADEQPWVLPETTPHAKLPSETPHPHAKPRQTVEMEDTSRFVALSQDGPPSDDDDMT
jgi:glycosyltransferase involved in cell wall biosynthesis